MKFFQNFAKFITIWSGSTVAFVIAIVITLTWLCCGPFFDWSDSWSLFINTFTTIITFLMVFLIQRSQNKDSLAIQMKLNELLAAHHGASNKLLNIEDLSEEDIAKIRARYKLLAEKHKGEDPTASHSIEEID